MIKRLLTSATSVALLAGMSTPAYALFIDVERVSRRTLVDETEGYYRLEHRELMRERSSRKAPTSDRIAQRRLLRGTINRREMSNSQPKTGTDRYRQLNIRPVTVPNTRSLRRHVEDLQSALPVNLVVTGYAQPQEEEDRTFDRPSRRSIRGDRDFNGFQS